VGRFAAAADRITMNLSGEKPCIGAKLPAARPLPTGPVPSPLTEAHFQLLRQAAAARLPVRSAARTARGSAVTILVIGVASIPLAVLYPSWLGTAVVGGICTIGVIEYIGAKRMRRGDPAAAVFLGRNQLAFLAVIVVYCLIQILTFSPAQLHSSLGSAELDSALSQMPEVRQQMDSLAPLATYGFYSLVIVVSIVAQGGLALYYFTRRRHLEALQRSTPSWVQRLFNELNV
jgi:hypothetical protein